MNVSELVEPYYDVDTALKVVQITLYSSIILIGAVGNGIICWTVFRNKQRRISEFLIANLAVTDLATCVVSIPFDLIERATGGFPFGSIMCFMVYPLQTVLMAVSVITLLCMSLERYRIVMSPLRPRMTARMAKICIVIAWIVPGIVITPYALVLRLEGKQCLENWPEDWYVKIFTLSIFVLFFVIPLFAIGISYARAGRKLQNDLLRFKKMSDTHSRTHALYLRKRALQKLRITKVFMLAFVVFTICMFPTHVTWLWHDFGSGRTSDNFYNILVFSSILTYINSAIDPFIFGRISIPNFGSEARRPEGLQCVEGCWCVLYVLRIDSLVAERQNAIRVKRSMRSRSSSSGKTVRRVATKRAGLISYVSSV